MDIIRHTLTLVAEKLADRLLPDELADIFNLVDAEVRRDWGGERAYISKTCERDLMDSCRRNAQIRQAWKTGESIQIIADRHGIHRSTVYRIISGQL